MSADQWRGQGPCLADRLNFFFSEGIPFFRQKALFWISLMKSWRNFVNNYKGHKLLGDDWSLIGYLCHWRRSPRFQTHTEAKDFRIHLKCAAFGSYRQCWNKEDGYTL